MTSLLVMGAGLIGLRHISAIKHSPDCQLAGVIEPNSDLHTDPEIRYFPSIDSVDVAAEGVIIATPTTLHAANGIAAAARGWHMLIEKPVVAAPEEAPALIEAINSAGLHGLAGHHRRYHPSVLWLREAMRNEAIGQPVTSSLIWAMQKPDDYFAGNWRTTDGSPVMINLIHDIDLIRFVLGEIEEVTALAGAARRGGGRVESGAVAMRLASGLSATISFADTTPSPWGFEAATGENPHIAATRQDMWWITGTRGGISFPSLTRWGGAEHWGEAARPQRHQAARVAPLATQLDHFIKVIRGIEAPLITVEDAARSLKVTYDIEAVLAGQIAAASQHDETGTEQ
jgi:predicted dehydrogenase